MPKVLIDEGSVVVVVLVVVVVVTVDVVFCVLLLRRRAAVLFCCSLLLCRCSCFVVVVSESLPLLMCPSSVVASIVIVHAYPRWEHDVVVLHWRHLMCPSHTYATPPLTEISD